MNYIRARKEPPIVESMGVKNKPARTTGASGWLNRPKTRRSIKIALFLAPILVFAVLFVYYPFVKTIINSFSIVNQKGNVTGFAELDNYKYVFGRNDFKKSILNSLIITGINVPITLVVTILLALIANKKRRLSPLYETLFTMPMAVSMSAACMVFKSMFSPTLGIINAMLGTQLGWFESRATALYTIIILTVWMGIGLDFLLFLSALRGIPTHVKDRENQERKQIFQTCKGIRMIITVRMLNCFADTAQSGGSFVICPFSVSWVFPCRQDPDTLQTARQSGAAWASYL